MFRRTSSKVAVSSRVSSSVNSTISFSTSSIPSPSSSDERYEAHGSRDNNPVNENNERGRKKETIQGDQLKSSLQFMTFLSVDDGSNGSFLKGIPFCPRCPSISCCSCMPLPKCYYRIPMRWKKFSSCCCCFLVIIFLNIIALSLTISLSLHYFHLRTVELTNKSTDMGNDIERLYEARKGMYEARTRSVVGFYFGSVFVDWEEFNEYVTKAEVFTENESSLFSVSWYTTIPFISAWKYEEDISSNKFKLPDSELEALNQTQPISSEEFLHVLTYSIPSTSNIGEKFTETSISESLFSTSETYTRLIKLDEGNEVVLEFLSPVMKSNNLSDSLVEYQGGFVSLRTDPLELINEATSQFSNSIDFVVLLKSPSSEDTCIYGCDDDDDLEKIDRFEETEKYGICWEIQFSDIVDSYFLKTYIFPRSDFYVTQYDVSAYLSIFLPFSISFFLALLTIFSCHFVMNHLGTVDHLRLFEKVASQIAVMDLESKEIKKIMTKRRPRRVERVLIRIILSLIEFRTYLPQTLLDRITGLGGYDDKKSSTSGKNSRGGSGKSTSRVSASSSTCSSSRGSVVEQRDVVVIMIDLSNKLAVRRKYVGGKLLEVLGRYHSIVHRIMKKEKYRASFHRIFGGFQMMFTLNAHSVRLSCGMDAVKSVWEVCENDELKQMGMKVACGVGKIHSFCGDMEVTDMNNVILRQFDCVPLDPENSLALESITTLQKLNRVYETKIIIDHALYEEVKYRSECKLLDIVELEESGFHRTFKIYEVFHVEMNIGDDEWMYEIEKYEGETKECFSVIEKSWSFVSRGEVGMAVEMIEKYLSSGENREKFGGHFWRLKQVMDQIGQNEEVGKEYKTKIVLV